VRRRERERVHGKGGGWRIYSDSTDTIEGRDLISALGSGAR
jgi:hypothetical protein